MAIPLPVLGGLGDATQAAFATPQNYASPEALKAQRDYANALLTGTNGKGGRQFPVVQSWTQGVSNMVNALMGGLDMHDAEHRENAANDLTGKRTTIPVPGGPPNAPGPTTPFSEGSSSAGQKTASDDDNSPQAKAIASVESDGSGGYNAVGPATRHGDRAYGKYQVMGENVPNWTREVLGKAMTPAEFLANPQAQDAVFKTKFAQGGDNDTDRASVWFTGKPYAQGANKSDGYINGAEYVRRFANAMPQGGAPSSALALAGPDGGGQAPAVNAITSALRGDANPQVAENTQVAAKGAAPIFKPGLPAPQGQPGQPPIASPPAQPQISQAQMQGIMSDPNIPWATKMQYQGMYLGQKQPQTVPLPGIGQVRIGADGTQQFIPEPHWGKNTSELGDMKKSGDTMLVPGLDGTVTPAPTNVLPSGGPRSDAGPAGGVGAPAASPGRAVVENAPAAPAAAPNAAASAVAEAEAAGKPVQVASNDPTAGIAKAAGTEAPTADNPLAKWAQATPPGGEQHGSPGQSTEGGLHLNMFTPQETEDYARKKAFDLNNSVNEDAQKKGTELAFKKYDTLSTQAQNARTLRPNVDLALGMMNDKNFHSGLLSGAEDIWARFKEAALGQKYANAPNETFDKLMASNVLGTMKTALGGLGQVRLAEIQLLNKANGNRYNTDASNRAVLEISRRGLEKIDQIDGMGQQYMSGDEVVDPISGKTLLAANVDRNGEVQPRRGLDVGFDKITRKWTNDNPSFTPEQIKNYETIFDTERPPEQGAAKTTEQAPGAAPKVGATQEFDDGKGGKVQGVWDGTKWGPKK